VRHTEDDHPQNGPVFADFNEILTKILSNQIEIILYISIFMNIHAFFINMIVWKELMLNNY